MSTPTHGQPPEPAHVVIDKDTTAKVNLGILVSIIAVAVMGAMYLQSIHHEVSTANTTLADLSHEFSRQNDALVAQSGTLIKQQAQIDDLERRLSRLE